MDGITALIFVAAGYLLGSLSFARLVTARLTHGRDVTQLEIPVADSAETYKVVSIGGNAASMALGARGGLLVSGLDILKVSVPTLAARLLFPAQPAYMLLAAVAGLAGHIWPIYHRFHGGSGFTPILAGLLVIDWPAALLLPVAGLLLGLLVFRNLIVASLAWIWLIIPWLWFRTNDPLYLAYAVGVNLLFLLAMVPEARLALNYGRAGRQAAYGQGNLQATPMGRGLLKLAARLRIPIR